MFGLVTHRLQVTALEVREVREPFSNDTGCCFHSQLGLGCLGMGQAISHCQATGLFIAWAKAGRLALDMITRPGWPQITTHTAAGWASSVRQETGHSLAGTIYTWDIQWAKVIALTTFQAGHSHMFLLHISSNGPSSIHPIRPFQ